MISYIEVRPYSLRHPLHSELPHNGVNESPCKKKGLTCIYSKKLQSRPHRSSAQRGHGDVGVPQHRESLKRCRLSASPATGLVGMEENVLLSAYFKCMGHVPITCQSNVREAMVRIMTSRFLTPTSASTPTRRTTTGAGKMINHGLVSDSSLCSFWFAVAMGGLLQGRPKEAVGTYILQTKAAVNAYSKVPTPELARVQLQVAVISAFSGDLDGFRVYVDRAHRVVHDFHLRDSLDQMQPVLLEMVRHFMFVQLLIGRRNSRENLQSFINSDLGPTPQVGNTITSEEMARFSMHAFRRHGQASFADALASLNKGGRKIEVMKTPGRQYFEGQLDPRLEHWAGLLPEAAVKEEPPVGRKVEQLQQELALTYERLENATRSARSGIVSLMFNVPLCITRIARQDTSGAVETASRVIEKLLSYPGLIRFELWMHVCHFLLTALSILESAELFEKLRIGYNEYRSRGPAIPPMEEWKGLGAYCNNFFCRTNEQELREGLLSSIQPEFPDDKKEKIAETAFPNGKTGRGFQPPSTVGRFNWFGLEKRSDLPTMKSDNLGYDSILEMESTWLEQMPDHSTMKSDNLRYDSILEVGSTVICKGEKGALADFPLGFSHDDPDKVAGSIVPLDGLDNPFDQVEADVLRPEDWEIAIDALLDDITTDPA